MGGTQPGLFAQLANHRLFGRLVGLNSTLRKLPDIAPHPARPKYPAFPIAQDNAHVESEAVFVDHNVCALELG